MLNAMPRAFWKWGERILEPLWVKERRRKESSRRVRKVLWRGAEPGGQIQEFGLDSELTVRSPNSSSQASSSEKPSMSAAVAWKGVLIDRQKMRREVLG